MICNKCGNQANPNEEFCSNCGKKLNKGENNLLQNNSSISSENNKKSLNNKIVIIIIVLITLIISLLLGIFIGKKIEKDNCNELLNKCESSKYEINTNENNIIDNSTGKNEKYTYNLYNANMSMESGSTNDLTKNIEIKSIFFIPKDTKYAQAYIYGKNNNNTLVSIDIVVDYYDSENYRIDEDSIYSLNVKANSEFVASIYVKDDSLNYKNTKLFYSAKKFATYNTDVNSDEIKIESNLIQKGTYKDIDITIKNNSNEKIKSGYLACLYYKDKKLIFATDAYLSDIEAKSVGKSSCYGNQLSLSEENSTKYIEYDDYKVILYSAYNYNPNY